MSFFPGMAVVKRAKKIRRAKARGDGDPGYINPFDPPKPAPKPKPAMPEKDFKRSQEFMDSVVASAQRYGMYDDNPGIVPNMTRHQMSKAQEKAANNGFAFAEDFLWKGSKIMDLSKYSDDRSMYGLMADALNTTGEASRSGENLGNAYLAARKLAAVAKIAKERMGIAAEVIGAVHASQAALKQLGPKLNEAISTTVGPIAQGIAYINSTGQLIRYLNQIRAAKEALSKKFKSVAAVTIPAMRPDEHPITPAPILDRPIDFGSGPAPMPWITPPSNSLFTAPGYYIDATPAGPAPQQPEDPGAPGYEGQSSEPPPELAGLLGLGDVQLSFGPSIRYVPVYSPPLWSVPVTLSDKNVFYILAGSVLLYLGFKGKK